ncbi:MAG: divalent metal cation transporter [Kiritimatiellae bacterium]|nr:divalent metal cation transporter [Kiritimatiellia bacterium]
MKKFLKFLSMIGPGIFAIGYTIGTGSVTTMAKSGADYGLGLLWVLALSCLFSGVLMSAYGRFAAVTGETSLHGIIKFLPCGKLLAALVFIGVIMGQYTCLGGILTLSSGAIIEAFNLKIGVFPVACFLMVIMYSLLMVGRYGFFEKVLVFFVMVMALTFIFSVGVTFPDAVLLKKAIKPLIPNDGASFLILAAFVGTTMAAPTFVTRPLLIKEKNLTERDLKQEKIDSTISAFMMFLISGAIIMVASSVLFANGKSIDKILDMAQTLEPVAGNFAVLLFMLGTLSAGLSSVFPIMMVAPILISDWRSGKMETRTVSFRILCLAAAAWGLVVPALGGNPIIVTVMAQISNVFVLPVTIIAIMWLLNKKDVMGQHRAGIMMNTALFAALVFSIIIAFTGVVALVKNFS